jgi:FtsP/CotA-like multicopper oxidase with cupredoxin domain
MAMNNKPRTFAAIVIGIVLLGTGGYLYLNSQQNKVNQFGEFSNNVRDYAEAKSSEVVELKNGDTYDLTASIVKKRLNGQEVKMLAYNGSIPGPLIKVQQNAQITINFRNDTDVDSTLHSHGIRMENKFDGVPDVTQEAVKPGESFTYKLKFPDVGIYWYHPHIREDYAQELGLYGNFLVTPSKGDYWAEVDREETLFLDDILIQNGQIAAFSQATVDHTLMGRFGNVMLVNGDDNYKLQVKQGERVRFYVTNAANTRVFNFTIPDTRMRLVGADNGKYEREEWVNSVTIGPSERTIVEVWFDKSGDYQIVNKTPEKSYTMGTISVASSPVTTSYFLVPRTNQDVIDTLMSLRPLFNKAPDKSIKLTLQMGSSNNSMGGHMMSNGQMMGNSQMSMGNPQKIEWEDDMNMMNSQSTKDTLKWKLIDQVSNDENMNIKWQFKQGDIVKIKIFNDDKSMHPMQHPIHIHGQKFLVLNTNGKPNQNLVWKDTSLIQTGDTVEFLVQMENPGKWVFHCHIPEHMESGMMSEFEVLET